MNPSILDCICCPVCKQKLRIHENELHCSEHRYAIVNNIPVLIRNQNPDFKPHFLDPLYRTVPSALNRFITFRKKHQSKQCFKKINSFLLKSENDVPKALIVGGGELGDGIEYAQKVIKVDWIESDIYVGSRTQVVCDAHDLPFEDTSFKIVICQSVLEHVRNPHQVAHECMRVLAPGGFLFVQASFMQQVHEGRADYFRFSPRALRMLFTELKVVQWGASQGAATSLVWSIRYLLRASLSFLPGGRMLSYLVYCTLLPVAFIWDYFLRHSRYALDAASEVYILFECPLNEHCSFSEADQFPISNPE